MKIEKKIFVLSALLLLLLLPDLASACDTTIYDSSSYLIAPANGTSMNNSVNFSFSVKSSATIIHANECSDNGWDLYCKVYFDSGTACSSQRLEGNTSYSPVTWNFSCSNSTLSAGNHTWFVGCYLSARDATQPDCAPGPNGSYCTDTWISPSRTITIGTPAPQQQPDLISSISAYSTSVPVNSSIYLTVYTTNIGNVSSNASWTALTMNGSNIYNFSIPNLTAGSSSTRSYDWICRSGSYIFNSQADYSNTNAESNEGNNAGTPITVTCVTNGTPSNGTSYVDLISNISANATSVYVGGTIGFTVGTTNIGTATSNLSRTVITKNGSSIYEFSTFLAAGASLTEYYNWTCPSSGTYIFNSQTDYLNLNAESNEDNNAGTPITVTCATNGTPTNGTSYVDLISNITANRTTVLVNKSVLFNVTTTNIGTAASTASRTVITKNGSNIYDFSISALPAEASNTSYYTWTCPSSGSYTFNSQADYDNTNAESNESNNNASVTVNCGTVQRPGVDLISNISANATRAIVNKSVLFNVTTTNIGTNSSNASLTALTINGSSISNFSIPRLAAGASNTSYYNWTCPSSPGNYTFNSQADYSNTNRESNEGNNAGTSVTVNCLPPPQRVDVDLTSNITANTTSVYVGGTIGFTVGTTNIGTGSSNASLTAITRSGLSIYNLSIPALTAGTSNTQNYNWTCPSSGSYIFNSQADYLNTNNESNEGNNAGTPITVQCSPAPSNGTSYVDLISNITANTTSVYVGGTIGFVVYTNNTGNATSNTSRTVITKNGSIYVYLAISNLTAGSSNAYYYDWTCPSSGSYTFNSQADYSNTNAESNEGNNAGTPITVQCSPAPYVDLISSISANATSVYVGGTIGFTVGTTNIGTGSSTASLTAITRNGSNIYNFSISNLTAGASTTQYYNWTCPSSGSYIFNSQADYLNTNNESNEGNNNGTSVTVTCSATPYVDLTSNISANASSVYVGGTIGFTVGTTNIGTGSSNASRTAITKNGLSIYNFSIQALAAGSSSTQNYNWTCPSSGSYTFNSQADYLNTNNESNESNNAGNDILISCTEVPQPDLVSSISANATKVTVNESVLFTVTTNNTGTSNSLPSITSLLTGKVPSITSPLTIANFSIGALEPAKAGAQNTTEWVCPAPGEYIFNSQADYLNTNNESNESNNAGNDILISCTEVPQPDLVSSISANATKVTVNESVLFTVTTNNTGTSNSLPSITSLLTEKDTIANFSIGALEPAKAGAQNTTEWVCPAPGEYIFNSQADYLNTNNESNEGNNAGTPINVTCANATSAGAPTIILLSPANNTLFRSTGDKPLTWNATDNASATLVCDLYVERAQAASVVYAGISVASGVPTTFNYNAASYTNYSWHVECRNAAGTTGTSETWSFRIGNDTTAPQIIQLRPFNGAYFNYTGAKNLVWRVEDDVSPTLSCQVYLNSTLINSSIVPNRVNITTLTPYLDWGVYNWDVGCTDEGDNFARSDTWNFTIKQTVCGDSVCEGYEDCTTCASDCGACQAVCPNGVLEEGEQCEVGFNTCDISSGMDCNYTSCACYQRFFCGDTICSPAIGENCTTCASDCGACQAVCGNGILEQGEECETGSPCSGSETCISSTCECVNCGEDGVCQNECSQDPDCCSSDSDCGTGRICSGGTCLKGNRTGCNYNDPPCGECAVCKENQCVDLTRQMHLDASLEAPVNSTVNGSVRDDSNHAVVGAVVNVTGPGNSSATYITDGNGNFHYVAMRPGYYTYSIPCAEFNPVVTSVYDPGAPPIRKQLVVPIYITEDTVMDVHAISKGQPIKADITINRPDGKTIVDTTDTAGKYETTLTTPGRHTVTLSAVTPSLSAKIDLSPAPSIKGVLENQGLLLLLLLLAALLAAAYLTRNRLLPLLTGRMNASLVYKPEAPKAGEEVIIYLTDEKGAPIKNAALTVLGEKGASLIVVTDVKGRALFVPPESGTYVFSSEKLNIKGAKLEVS